MSTAYGDGDSSMRYESSVDLSPPPSGPTSAPASPNQKPTKARRVKAMNPADVTMSDADTSMQYEQTMTVPASENAPTKHFGMVDGVWVQLTATGRPRKKPGRKPGAGPKSKSTDGPDQQQAGQSALETQSAQAGQSAQPDQPKARKPRKPKDPNAPPVQRKRKIAPADTGSDSTAPSAKLVALAPDSANSSSKTTPAMAGHQRQTSSEQPYPAGISKPKRESSGPAFMQSILNAETPTRTPSTGNGNTMPVRTVGQSYDPIRDGKYDPVRETMVANPYSPNSGSPRAPSQALNRSPSIASMIEPQAPPLKSPSHSQSVYASRFQNKESSIPTSSSISKPTATPAQAQSSLKKEQAAAPPSTSRSQPNEANFTTIANGPVKKASPKQKAQAGVSTPKTDNLEDTAPEGEERSILDFGRAKPGEETQTPTIVLNIPIKIGENNKYINFMRLAEDHYGWDALHPRLAANRDRKARIAAATASLQIADSGRDSGDEMSVDLSDVEGSNIENGGTTDAQVKPKKKRNLKMDNYDVHDDFVDDSELMWEAQAAASCDGFFVYSGPLIPEVEKPPAGRDDAPKRGRGGGKGSRGGRGGASTRGGAATGRGSGTGARGGAAPRKPRATKSEKVQKEKEKAERESLAQGSGLQPTTPSFAPRELEVK